VQRVRKAIEPVGEAKPDWQIICLVATAMGYPMQYGSPAEIMEEIARLTPSYGGISYQRLENGSLVWPCPAPDHPGTPILHAGKFARGLGKFHPVEYVPPAEQPDEEYPLILNTGRRHFHYHTGTMTLRTGALEEYYGREHLEINPADARALGIADGERVRVVSRRGQVEVTARVVDTVPPGVVFTSFHFPDVAINKLTNPARDPVARIPELKVCAVRVEKIA
jgi:formate dehydrogenase major subunit/formate dehydrogenase alpha subunit